MVNLNECEAAGIDPDKLDKVVKSLERNLKKLKSMGLFVFGGDGGTIRQVDAEKGDLILASLCGCDIEGGRGREHTDSDGLERGDPYNQFH